MKRFAVLLAAVSLMLSVHTLSAEEKEAEQAEQSSGQAPKSKKDRVSYCLGLNIGKSMRQQELDVAPAMLAKGIEDGLKDAKPLLTQAQIQQTMSAFQQEMIMKQQEKMKTLSEKSKKEGEAFLAENKKKEGVKTLPSGLQYEVLKEGEGASPNAKDTVTVNYKGTLVDGTVFDSSYKRGEPATFPVTGVIPGWTEALQKMKTGGKWRIFVPSDLAYGERGAGNIIPPNATLIFEIELLSIK
jgi:FKBP-type peptidyl-prolyl cis-trans isomerase FklB